MDNNIELKYSERAKVLKALAHPTRLFIVDELSNGEQSVQDIADMVKVDISTISRHLSVLKNAALVKTQKRGLKVFYSLTVPCVLDFFGCIENVTNQNFPSCLCNSNDED